MSRPPRLERTAAPELEAPRLATAWAALVYVVATLLLSYPALFGDFLVWPRSDQYIAGYAFREFAAESLKSGSGFPQWNPYLFGGMPYIAAMHGDIFYPTFLLRMIMPTDQAMTWGFAIHLFLAGLLTFGFLRALGLGFSGALVGGLAYMLSGPIAGYASPGHDGKLFVSALLPAALWMLVRGVRDGRAWSWGLLALVIGLAVLSPHPQLLQYMLLASGAFALYLALADHDGHGKLPRRLAVRRLGMALGSVVLGGLMGAVQYLPLRSYVDWSPRAGGTDWAHVTSFSMPPEELINAFVPQFSGLLNDYWGRNNIHLHSEYAGVAVLILAGAGMFAPQFRRGFRWFWLGTFVVSLLWAMGGFTPFYRLVYVLVPGTKFFRAPSTMMYVTMFSLAVFAALGTERVMRAAASIPKRFVLAWGAGLLVLGLFLAGGLAQMVAQGFGRVVYADANQGAVVLGVVRSLVFAAAILALIYTAGRGRLNARVLGWTIAAIVTADLWSIARKYWIFSPPARELFAADAAIELLKADTVPGRVLPLALPQFPPAREAGIVTDRAFSGDHMMVHRIRSVTGYHGNELGRYQVFEPALSDDATLRVLSPQFWRHENVRYWYTTVPDTLLPMLGAQLQWTASPQKVLGPITNRAGSTIYLYRLPGDNPAAWVANALVKGTDDQALATVMDSRFEPTRVAIVDTGAAVPVVSLDAVPPPATTRATVTRFDAGRINVRLDGPVASGNAIVVSENYFPGWRATIDGRDATVTRANYNLMAVPLVDGAREVQLWFIDEAYLTGKWVTLVALVAAALLAALGAFADRRALRATPA
jgi:hypothetical protein